MAAALTASWGVNAWTGAFGLRCLLAFLALEQPNGGRLGVAAADTPFRLLACTVHGSAFKY